MDRTPEGFSRYRPRVLTVLVVSLTTTLLVLSNLSYVRGRQEGSVIFWHNYGWPLVWYRAVYADLIFVWQIDRAKLGLDAAVWLLILVAAGGVCEWLVRRYRPRLRWSLRTMLVVTALVGACCGWFTVASRRARQQNEIVALFYGKGGHPANQHLWIERWGPRWLDLFGADRYFQHVVGAEYGGQRTEDVVNRLKDLPQLRLLYLEADRFSPVALESLNAMRQLRILSVSQGEADDRTSKACLAGIGRMSRLEELRLKNLNGEALARLGGLRELRSLHLKFARLKDGHESYDKPHLLTCLPVFPQLETLTFDGSYVRNEDLRRLAAQSGLKALRIETKIIDADLSQLLALDMLEELTIAATLSTDDILALHGLKHLKILHISDIEGNWPWKPEFFEPDFDTELAEARSQLYRQALSDLKRARPGIVIDSNTRALAWDRYRAIPSGYESPIRFLQSPRVPWLQPSFWKHSEFDNWIGNVPW